MRTLSSMSLNLIDADGYEGAQKIRVLSESWLGRFGYCPDCAAGLEKARNNAKAHDFSCVECHAEFELKCTSASEPKRLVNGAYNALIDRLNSESNPHLFVLSYKKTTGNVNALEVIPSYFFTPDLVQARKPLAATARRAGWVGCNIFVERVPRLGRIALIRQGVWCAHTDVSDAWRIAKKTKAGLVLGRRGWLMAIVRCVEELPGDVFALHELYGREREFFQLFPNNRNVRAKIRQQLQVLRDRGLIEFLGQGVYRKLWVRR